MRDFIFKDILFGNVGFEYRDTGKPGYSIVFQPVRDYVPTVEDILKDIEEGTEKYSCWTIHFENDVVDQVKAFSSPTASELMEKDYDSLEDVYSALEQLKVEFQNS